MFGSVPLRAKWKMLVHDLFVSSNYADKQKVFWTYSGLLGYASNPLFSQRLCSAFSWDISWWISPVSSFFSSEATFSGLCRKFPLFFGSLAMVGKTSECQRLSPGLRYQQAGQAAEACCLAYFVFTVLLLRVWGPKPTGC